MIDKTINPGALDPRDGRDGLAQVYCTIRYKDERLSISGVIGPKSNGDARGSCGQIADTIREEIEAGTFVPSNGWTIERVRAFLDTWDRWHLNDMHPECEHQRALGWREAAAQRVKIYLWQLKDDVSAKKKDLEREAIERAASLEPGRSVAFHGLDRRIVKLEEFIKTASPDLGELARFYRPTRDTHGYFAHVEEKARGWLSHDDPDVIGDTGGLLGKPCPTCGYKYGSAWKHEAVPADTLAQLEALPITKNLPAWT